MSLKVGWFTDPRVLRYRRILRFIPTKEYDYSFAPGSVWIRCLQLIPFLEERGIHSQVNEFQDEVDICVFVRWLSEEAYRVAVSQKEKGRRIMVDLPVNYFDVSTFDGFGVSWEQVQECLRMVSLADVVICGSAHIAHRASDFHDKVIYIPDSINHRHFSMRKREKDFLKRCPRAIWSGYALKAEELQTILPILHRKDIPLIIIAERKPKLDWPFKFVRWRYNHFPRQLLRGEFCVAPRRLDNPYNLGHSLFKVGVFMAQGVPVLASPVPSYLDIIGNSKPGVICESANDWEKVIDSILYDRHMLLEWSRQSIDIMQKYHTDQIVNRYLELFYQIT